MSRNSLEYGNETEDSYSTEENALDLVRGIADGRLDDAGVKDILLSEMDKHRDVMQERIEAQWAADGRRDHPVVAEHEVARKAWAEMWPHVRDSGYGPDDLNGAAAALHRAVVDIRYEGTGISQEELNDLKGIPKEEPQQRGFMDRLRSFGGR